MLELSTASYHLCIFPCHNNPDFPSSLLLSVISNCATLKSVLTYNYDIGYSHEVWVLLPPRPYGEVEVSIFINEIVHWYWFVNACECAGLLYIGLRLCHDIKGAGSISLITKHSKSGADETWYNAEADMLAVAILSLNILFSINMSYADTPIRWFL